MSFKEKSFFYKINPISYASIILMFGYQRLISKQIGAAKAKAASFAF